MDHTADVHDFLIISCKARNEVDMERAFSNLFVREKRKESLFKVPNGKTVITYRKEDKTS